MYCRRYLRYMFMRSKRRSISSDHKKVLKTSEHGLETRVPLSTSCHDVILDKKCYCWRIQGGATSSYLNHDRNFQTAVMHFPRRCKTGDGSEISSSGDYEKAVLSEVVASRLQKCSSIQEQMEELCSILCLTPDDMKERKELSVHIQKMLSPFFNNFRVQLYGSSANGFGLKGCDVDMSLDIIGDNRKPGRGNFTDPDVPSVHDVLEGKVSIDYLAKLSQRDQLLFVHSVFLEYYKETAKPIIFFNSYVPIVRFYYDKCSLQCDMSLGNSVAFRNTKLLKLCRLLDDRVNLLMVTIRYWAKRTGLIGGQHHFNTYTVSLLVLFFLQTRTPPVVPSVEYLLSISEYLNNDDMDDESYLQILEKIPPSENNQSIVELLKEFFFYYAYFDYNQVMCPVVADSLPRTKVHSIKRSFRMNTIAVQDPIKLSHNVANLVDFVCCKKFFTELLLAVRLFHEKKLLSPSSSNWGVLALLEKPENYTTALPEDDPMLALQIPYVPLSTENEKSKTSSYSDEDMKQAWFQKVSQVVLDLLEYGLLFECKVCDSERSREPLLNEHLAAMKNNETVSVDNNNHCVLEVDSSAQLKDVLYHKKPNFVVNCTAYHNTWLGRDDVKRKISSSESSFSSFLELEHSVSVELNNQRKIDEKKGLISFACECYELDDGEHASLFLKLKPINRTDFHPIVGLFLRDYIPKTVSRILSSTKVEPSRKMNVINNL